MPLDDFQKRVVKTIAPNRSMNSPIAGGGMLQQFGIRLSNDTDIFIKDEDVNTLFESDRQLLAKAGFYVEKTRTYEGFIEALVASMNEDEPGRTHLQWVSEGLNGFFPAIRDEEVGFRLHFADLAVNKLLACTGRKKLRDFVDMWMIDAYSMPLWRLALAAPGKDTGWSPRSLIERFAANMVFSPVQFESDVDLLIPIEPKTIIQGLRCSIDEARIKLDEINISMAGKLAVIDGQVVTGRDIRTDVEWIDVYAGGNPHLAGFRDDNLVQPIIEKFGIDGAYITDKGLCTSNSSYCID